MKPRGFEQDFPYIETDDQLRSIEEIKKDMESNQKPRTDCWLEMPVLTETEKAGEQPLR